MSPGYFITGTDTGVGKTVVACALLHAFAARGLTAAGMKPVASGATLADGALRNEDVEQLLAAANVAASRHIVNPYCFEPPIAPHIAAARAGVTIDLDHIVRCCAELAAQADVVIVEGIGGFSVPLGPGNDTAALALPVVLVVGMRLGCLNHALLTAAAVRASGLDLAGWVANHVEPDMACADENVNALASALAAPLLARIGYARAPDPRTLASAIDVKSLEKASATR